MSLGSVAAASIAAALLAACCSIPSDRAVSLGVAIDLACEEARRLNYDVSLMNVSADLQNQGWASFVDSLEPELVASSSEGMRRALDVERCWAILLSSLDPDICGGGVMVFIAKRSGEVIYVWPQI